MNGRSNKTGREVIGLIVILALAIPLIAISACQRQPANEPGSYVSHNPADCLPNITLKDQYGRPVSLSSLKGRPVLIDFIYTTCPGPCEMMTAKMVHVADALKKELGSDVTLVSVTLDPEHDGPKQLLAFAKEQNAERKGWLFLTGTPSQIERLLTPYRIRRIREPGGLIGHVLEMFLLAPDGHQLRLYSATTVTPNTVAEDVNRAIAEG